jgi:hypothetical protein
MKSFITFLREQNIDSDESTLDPNFLEKKQKKDTVVTDKIDTNISDVDKDLEQAKNSK